MAKSKEDIIKDIDSHLTKSGRRFYSEFYIGITNDVVRRLFTEHNVSKDKMWWIYRRASSAQIAREVEAYYIKKGMRGGSGGGNDESLIVYCYAIHPTTIE